MTNITLIFQKTLFTNYYELKNPYISFSQLCGRGHRRPPEHARRHPHRPGPLRGPRAQEVAVRRVVERRHDSEPGKLISPNKLLIIFELS